MKYYLVKNATPSELTNSTINTDLQTIQSNTYHILTPNTGVTYVDAEEILEYNYLLVCQSEYPTSTQKGRHGSIKKVVLKSIASKIEYRFMVENALADPVINIQLLKKLNAAFSASHDGLMDLAFIEINSNAIDSIFTQTLKDSLVSIFQDELKFFPWMLPTSTY